MVVEKIIRDAADLLKLQAAEAKEATKREKRLASINPNCYVAKEIFYQTALLQHILTELKTANTRCAGCEFYKSKSL